MKRIFLLPLVSILFTQISFAQIEKPSFTEKIEALINQEGIPAALALLEEKYAPKSENNPDVLEAYEILANAQLQAGNEKAARQLFIKAAPLRAGDGFYQMSINPPKSYMPTVIPKDPKALFEYRGDLTAKAVFIFLQGGPDPFLSVDNRRDPFYALANRDDILRVYPYQSQMMNHTVFSPKYSLTPENAAFERQQSAEILHQTIAYFKKQGKSVYVFAHSFGSQLTLEYLENKPNNADRIIMMGGKLDNDINNYPDLPPGQLIRWRRGLEPLVSTWHNSYAAMPLIEKDFYQVINNTKALVVVHRKKQFTKILKNKRLNNVIFVHAKFDEASGRQAKAELDFLKSKGVSTIGTYGDHHSMLSPAYMASFYNSIIENETVKPSLAYIFSNHLEDHGMEAAMKWFSKIDQTAYFLNENEFNTLGYDLVAANKLKEAIEVFKINVAAFPNSWNVYDSLGETYMAAGNKALAIFNYEKSLQINPDNQFGKDALLKLK
ncbi:MAG: hypothetical protein Sapg2KO_39580 [Saprospiraceae bacterium]